MEGLYLNSRSSLILLILSHELSLSPSRRFSVGHFFSVVVATLWMSSLTFSMCLLSLSPQGCLYLEPPQTNLLKFPFFLCFFKQHRPLYLFTLAVLESLASICPPFFPRHPTSASFHPFPDSFFHPFSAPLFCPHKYFRLDGQIPVSVELM